MGTGAQTRSVVWSGELEGARSDVHDFPVPDAPTTQRLKGVGCRHHRLAAGERDSGVGVDGKEKMV